MAKMASLKIVETTHNVTYKHWLLTMWFKRMVIIWLRKL